MTQNDQKALAITLFQEGMKYLAEGKSDDALEKFSKALEYDPDNAEIYMNRGFTREIRGQTGTYDYEKAYKLNPGIRDLFLQRRCDLKKIYKDKFPSFEMWREQIRINVSFDFNEKEQKQFLEWVKTLDKTRRTDFIVAEFTFCFSITNAGMIKRVIYHRDGIYPLLGLKEEVLDLTDYEDFFG